MTASSSRSWEMTVGEIVVAAMRLAGLLAPEETPSALQARHGRDQLGLLIKSPAFSQAVSRGIVTEELTLDGVELTYELPAYVIEVQGDGWHVADGQVGKSIVFQKARFEFEGLQPNEDTTAPPSAFLFDRSVNPPTVTFWPGAEAGVVRLICHRQRADVTDANATLDLEPHWMDAVVQGLAGRLAAAASLPTDRIGIVTGMARQARGEAREHSADKVSHVAELEHRTHRCWR